MKNSKITIPVIVIICLLIGFGGGMFFQSQNSNSEIKYDIFNKTTSEVDIDFSLFWNTWELLNKKYINQPIDQQKLFYGAIKGMVEAIDDPYSSFMDPEETTEFQDELNGEFEGIGAEIGMKNDKIVVIAPIENSPASKAGVRAGDWIISINDETTTDLSLLEAVNKIRGESGTEVKLSIIRTENQTEPTEITIKRAKIEVPSVKSEELDGGIVKINISSFGTDTATEFSKIARSLQQKETKGIIIDLRNNSGGLLTASIDMLSEFIETGKVVVTEEFGDGKKQEFRTSGAETLKDIPTVVLVNEGSASASEIMAGALSELKKIPLIGKNTYGKGTVQDLENLAQKTSIRITVAKWLLPSGEQIPEDGIKPDHEVELTLEDYEKDKDPQLDKALDILNSKIK